jgi:dihydrofolate reductase
VISLIWAEARGGVIGASGTQPFELPEDMAHFRRLTKGHPVVMGRHTWLALPEQSRPLRGRANIVMTHDRAFKAEGATVVQTLGQALGAAADSGLPSPVWCIGGGAMYRLFEPLAGTARVTVVDLEVEGDTFAPVLEHPWAKTKSDPAEGWHTSANGIRYRFDTWRRAGAR